MNSPANWPWPRVVQVTPLTHGQLKVRLADGQEWQVDLAPLIAARDAYWRLRQQRYFCQVGIDPLGALSWPEGEDLAPESLPRYRQVN